MICSNVIISEAKENVSMWPIARADMWPSAWGNQCALIVYSKPTLYLLDYQKYTQCIVHCTPRSGSRRSSKVSSEKGWDVIGCMCSFKPLKGAKLKQLSGLKVKSLPELNCFDSDKKPMATLKTGSLITKQAEITVFTSVEPYPPPRVASIYFVYLLISPTHLIGGYLFPFPLKS